MVEPLRHRQTQGAATDMPGLLPPRHIPTLPDLAVYGRDGERRFSSAVTAVGERVEILAPEYRGPGSRRAAISTASVHSSTCSEMLSASSTSMPR